MVRLRRASEGKRIKSKRKPRFARKIPYDRQAQRLGEVFQKAASALAGLEQGVDVAADPRAVIPERCLVFELIGPVAEFNVAAQALGLEWLLAEAAGTQVDEDGEEDSADEDVPEPKVLYLTMPSERALRRLLAQWNQYSRGEPEDRKSVV